MTGDAHLGTSESGGGISGSSTWGGGVGGYSPINPAGTSVETALLNAIGIGGGGGGRMAARGAQQFAQLMAAKAFGQSLLSSKLSFAYQQLNAFPESQRQGAVLIQTPQSNPAIKAAGEELAKLMALRQAAVTQRKQMNLAKRAQAVQTRIAQLQAKAAPFASYQYVAQYGINNGPPLGG